MTTLIVFPSIEEALKKYPDATFELDKPGGVINRGNRSLSWWMRKSARENRLNVFSKGIQVGMIAK